MAVRSLPRWASMRTPSVGRSSVKAMSSCSAREAKGSAISRSNGTRSTGCIRSVETPESSRESRRRLADSWSSRSAWRRALAMSRSRVAGSSCPRAISRSASRAVSGVPNSWAASATNLCRAEMVCSTLPAMSLKECARVPISSVRSTGARTDRSPRAIRPLAAVMARSGRVMRLLVNQPTIAASTTAATPASDQATTVVRSTAAP